VGRLPTLQPDTTLQLGLTLRVPGPTTSDEVLAFQLLDGRGQAVAQTQTYGNVDLRFSTLWSAGQAVPYQLRLALPVGLATGVYTLSLQRFDPAGGDLQPLADGSGQIAQRLTLATVKVPAPQAPPGLIATERFGSDIGLLGTSGQRLQSVTAQPGATISIPLRWLALDAPANDYTVFVHLLDSTGKLVAQADGPPLAGQYPTTAWDRGELVADTRQLQLPANLAAGRYVVHVGWYLPATGSRLATLPAVQNDSVQLEYVDVVAAAPSAR
jgi:hypothetical protein